MNAEEYLKGLNEHDPVFELDTEYEYTEEQLINFAERYHQKQLKLLRIGAVVSTYKCDHEPKNLNKKHTSCKKCKMPLQVKP